MKNNIIRNNFGKIVEVTCISTQYIKDGHLNKYRGILTYVNIGSFKKNKGTLVSSFENNNIGLFTTNGSLIDLTTCFIKEIISIELLENISNEEKSILKEFHDKVLFHIEKETSNNILYINPVDELLKNINQLKSFNYLFERMREMKSIYSIECFLEKLSINVDGIKDSESVKLNNGFSIRLLEENNEIKKIVFVMDIDFEKEDGFSFEINEEGIIDMNNENYLNNLKYYDNVFNKLSLNKLIDNSFEVLNKKNNSSIWIIDENKLNYYNEIVIIIDDKKEMLLNKETLNKLTMFIMQTK